MLHIDKMNKNLFLIFVLQEFMTFIVCFNLCPLIIICINLKKEIYKLAV